MTGSFAYAALLGFAFCFPFSLPAGRGFLALAAAAVAVQAVRARRWPRVPAVFWFALAFLLWTVWATFHGLAPELGVGKLDKLLWFLAIPVTSLIVNTPDRMKGVLRAFALGVGVLSLEICFVRPVQALHGELDGFMANLTDMGSMTDGQILMLGFILLLAVQTAGQGRGLFAVPAAGWIAWALTGAALVLNLKRGSWICTAFLVVLLLAGRRRWRLLALLLAVALGLTATPPVRHRLAGLTDEFDPDQGGRVTMWTRVAPVLIKDHPMGIGYRSLTAHLVQRIAYRDGFYVEPGRDHLHSNFIQILVATGWVGLGLYLLWMGRALWDAFCVRARAQAPPGLASSLGFMLVGLLGNGTVEYNFGDAEVVLAYGLIMGCCAVRRLNEQRPMALS